MDVDACRGCSLGANADVDVDATDSPRSSSSPSDSIIRFRLKGRDGKPSGKADGADGADGTPS